MFLHNLFEKLGRVRVIRDRQTRDPYMIRYYLFLKNRKNFPFNLTLHKILKSDDPVLHDHPWSYGTIILKGGYYETVPVFSGDGEVLEHKTYWRGPGYMTFRKSSSFHYLTLKADQPCTTLFFMGPQKTVWGFLTEKGWTLWTDYIRK
jgi:hypothetical protein